MVEGIVIRVCSFVPLYIISSDLGPGLCRPDYSKPPGPRRARKSLALSGLDPNRHHFVFWIHFRQLITHSLPYLDGW